MKRRLNILRKDGHNLAIGDPTDYFHAITNWNDILENVKAIDANEKHGHCLSFTRKRTDRCILKIDYADSYRRDKNPTTMVIVILEIYFHVFNICLSISAPDVIFRIFLESRAR